MPHPLWALAFALLGSAILAMLGLLAGMWADKFDQLAAFQNFIIVPLTFLSGVFYSIHSLPPFWQALSHANPFFYMIDGFRYGFFGVSDISPAVSLAIVAAAAVALGALTLALLARGWKLRTLEDTAMVTPDSIRASIETRPALRARRSARRRRSTSRRSSCRAAFAGLSRIKQHQLVYAALGDRMREEIHALSMQTLTPEQWAERGAWISLRSKAARRCRGEVRASGAKNAALPLLCAALLAPEPLTLTNVPRLNDVRTMQSLLAQMGVALDTSEPGTVALDASRIDWPLAPYELVKTMRASILALGSAARPLRRGARVAARRLRDRPAPGRPARQGPAGDGRRDRPRRTATSTPRAALRGAKIVFDVVTVTGTENLLMAATLAEGTTVLENAAREPEVVDLARCLIAMGARITGAGTDRIVIEGVAQPARRDARDHARSHRDRNVPRRRRRDAAAAPPSAARDPDSLEAVHRQAARGGRRRSPSTATSSAFERNGPLDGGQPAHRAASRLSDRHAGAVHGARDARRRHGGHHRDDLREPDDARAGAACASAPTSKSKATPRSSRACAKLTGANVMATDLRASACLVIAGLVAEGETTIDRIYHLDRGYERIEEKLSALGARIERVK